MITGEQLFPSSQFEGITDDEISSQVTDDSLPYSMDLSGLDNNCDSGENASVIQLLWNHFILWALLYDFVGHKFKYQPM